MAKAYTFSSSGGLVPVDALEAATSISIASAAFAADTSGITMGSDKDITLSGGGEVLGLPATPSSSDAAASKAYVESYAASVASGLDVKKSVTLATNAALAAVTYANGTSGVGATLTADSNGALSVDSVAVVAGDRILVKDQVAGIQNGIYVVTDAGAIGDPFILTRATDADTGGANGELTPGAFTFVEKGTVNADTGWVLSSPDSAITMGSTNIAFTQFSNAGTITAGAGLTKTGNTLDVVSGNPAIVVNANDITLTLASNSGLDISTGLLIDLDSNSGLALGAGGIKIDVSTLSDGSGAFSGTTIDDDYFPYYDVANSATKRISFANFATTMAGVGLAASSGVLALALSELSDVTIDPSADSFAIIDASNSNASAKETIADFIDAVAGNGLSASAGVLAVALSELMSKNSPDSSDLVAIVDASDSSSKKITMANLSGIIFGAGSVTSAKMKLLTATSSLVSAAAISSPECKAVYLVAGSGKINVTANSQAGMHVQGLLANTSNIAGADEGVDLYTVDGSLLTIPSAARNAANFALGAVVYADASGLLTTDFANDIGSGDWCCPVGTSVTTGSMILRIGLPFQKA